MFAFENKTSASFKSIYFLQTH